MRVQRADVRVVTAELELGNPLGLLLILKVLLDSPAIQRRLHDVLFARLGVCAKQRSPRTGGLLDQDHPDHAAGRRACRHERLDPLGDGPARASTDLGLGSTPSAAGRFGHAEAVLAVDRRSPSTTLLARRRRPARRPFPRPVQGGARPSSRPPARSWCERRRSPILVVYGHFYYVPTTSRSTVNRRRRSGAWRAARAISDTLRPSASRK